MAKRNFTKQKPRGNSEWILESFYNDSRIFRQLYVTEEELIDELYDILYSIALEKEILNGKFIKTYYKIKNTWHLKRYHITIDFPPIKMKVMRNRGNIDVKDFISKIKEG